MKVESLLFMAATRTFFYAPALLSLCLLVISHDVTASPVTLKERELVELRTLVANDNRASAIFHRLRKLATATLPERPSPIVEIFSEGYLKSDPKKVKQMRAWADMQKIEALAWTGAVSGDERYNKKTLEFILAWASVNRSDGNPINETKFEPLIEAYDLIRPSVSSSEREKIDRWLRHKANLLWENQVRRKENFQSHRLKIVGLIAETIDDARLWRIVEEGFKMQINENFESSGVSADFIRRDALHYHLYATKPLLTLACVAERRGSRLYTYHAENGASLQLAIAFMQPFVSGEKQHIEFSKSKVGFDKRRAAAGELQYTPHKFKPKSAISALTEAGCLDPKYDALASDVSGEAGGEFVDWRAVLNAAIERHAQLRERRMDK